MRKRLLAVTLSVMMTASMLAGCGGKADTKDTKKVQTEQDSSKEEGTAEESSEKKNAAEDAGLEDGVYTAEFHTDSSMFHANETKDGKGTLTVKDGKMVFHVTLHSKNIVNLFPGKAEDAQKDGAELLQPTVDTVTYSDGTTEEVYGFDIPVPAIDEEFDLALIGKKNKWYDHKVKVTNPQKESDEVAEKTKDAKDTSKKASEK